MEAFMIRRVIGLKTWKNSHSDCQARPQEVEFHVDPFHRQRYGGCVVLFYTLLLSIYCLMCNIFVIPETVVTADMC